MDANTIGIFFAVGLVVLWLVAIYAANKKPPVKTLTYSELYFRYYPSYWETEVDWETLEDTVRKLTEVWFDFEREAFIAGKAIDELTITLKDYLDKEPKK